MPCPYGAFNPKLMTNQEGKAKFKIGRAFYRPQGRVVRDLGVLAAAVYREDMGRLRVLEAMAGCGVRSLRYWLECGADELWVNEGNPEIISLVRENLADLVANGCGRVTQKDALEVFFEAYNCRDFYDLVDVDCFGSASPYLSSCLWGTKIGGLVYITSTDGRTVAGKQPEKCLAAYGAYARSHPAIHEQGLRLLLGSLHREAAAKGLGIAPVFCLFWAGTYRVMARLVAAESLTPANYGFLGYCHSCGSYQLVSWRHLGRVVCREDGENLVLSGPMWLGELHDRPFLTRMQALAHQWQWPERVTMLEIMAEETDFPPYFYPLGEIGRRGKMDIPKRDYLISTLQNQGFRATATHINPQAIKTDASISVILAAARQCSG